MSTKPRNTGNLFKSPFIANSQGNTSDKRQNEGEVSPNVPHDGRGEIVNHETIQTSSMPNSAPSPNLGENQVKIAGLETAHVASVPSSPNALPKSGPLYATGGLNGGTPGMAYGATSVATQIPAPQSTVPARTKKIPKPKELIKRARARYNSLPKRSKIMLAILAVCMLFPLSIALLEGINAIAIYSQARSGMQHITNVKNLFTGSTGHASNLLDVNKLNQAQQELEAAHGDFLQLSNDLDQDGVIGLAGGPFPRQIQTLRSLSHIGVDATEIGVHLMGTGKKLAPSFKNPIMPGANTQSADVQNSTPLITQSTLDIIKADIDYLLPKLDQMIPYTHDLDLGILPVSDQQKQQIGTLLQALPQARSDLAQAEPLMGAFGWIIGVDKPRTFLVQTMDRSELRAGGGFTGQFGMLNLNGGRMGPFNLQNIGPFEEDAAKTGTLTAEEQRARAATSGNTPPAPFTWWPVPNFGLRDSNISADFPTSAKISIDLANLEFQQNVDGVIVFSPFLIAHMLEITGPLTVPKYNETITAQNLEARLHFYQLDNAGITKEQQVENVQDPDQARKLFTKTLGNVLIQHVVKSPPDELLGLAREMLYAMQTKDLQIYVTNNDVEQLLAKYGSTSQIDTSPNHDGLLIVQTNVSVSKASQYVQSSVQDTVTVDADGGATHVMNMRLTYAMQGLIYGWDYYRDYVRVYVPPNSQLLWGNGFDNHYRPQCGSLAGDGPCQTDVYGDGTLICPPNVDAGDGVQIIGSPHPLGNQPVDQVGGPTNTDSDMPGRAMYGGWVNIPKNCTMNVSLSWHVPPQGNQPYSLMLQRQSSTFPSVDLTILPTPGNCSKLQTMGMHFSGVLSGADTLFRPQKMQGGASTNGDCYPNSKV